mmetsp:Transcript_60435/g.82912  ORF Transcript_60435/g.82912 Transcript_60435/m.82912 type:complete len:206 (+) Transcript_60435:181-798(+)
MSPYGFLRLLDPTFFSDVLSPRHYLLIDVQLTHPCRRRPPPPPPHEPVPLLLLPFRPLHEPVCAPHSPHPLAPALVRRYHLLTPIAPHYTPPRQTHPSLRAHRLRRRHLPSDPLTLLPAGGSGPSLDFLMRRMVTSLVVWGAAAVMMMMMMMTMMMVSSPVFLGGMTSAAREMMMSSTSSPQKPPPPLTSFLLVSSFSCFWKGSN